MLTIIAGNPNSGKTTTAIKLAGNNFIFSVPTIAQAIDLGIKFTTNILTGNRDFLDENNNDIVCTHGTLLRAMGMIKYSSIIIDEAQLALSKYKNSYAGLALKSALLSESNIILICDKASLKSLKLYCEEYNYTPNIINLDSLSKPIYANSLEDMEEISKLEGQTLLISCDIKDLFERAEELKELNKSYGIFYGNLTAFTKLKLLNDFNNGRIQFLLATDSVAIGCDFKLLKNIVFLSLHKCGEYMSFSEIKQICYRSGRGTKQGIIYMYAAINEEEEKIKASLNKEEEVYIDKVYIDERRKYLELISSEYEYKVNEDNIRDLVRNFIIPETNKKLTSLSFNKLEIYALIKENISYGYYDEETGYIRECSPRYYLAEEYPELNLLFTNDPMRYYIDTLVGCLPIDDKDKKDPKEIFYYGEE